VRSFRRQWILRTPDEKSGVLPEGFDEATYLLLHPDVGAAVAKGLCKSGLRHYLEHGRREGRHLSIEPRAAVLSPFLARLEARIVASEKVLESEATRLDLALAVCDNVALKIASFHQVRRGEQYQAAFAIERPLISVCLASGPKDVRFDRAIHSVRAQTYRNLQIIIIGQDRHADIGRKLAALRDDRIFFESIPEGVAARDVVEGAVRREAMNRALSHCEGSFVTHLDSYDEFMPTRIEELLVAAREQRADFLWHSFLRESNDGSWIRQGDSRFEPEGIIGGSIFYHRYFAADPWINHADQRSKAWHWNRIRRIKILRSRLHFLDSPLLRRFRESIEV
jgi:Glycosyl transferase family 2